MRIRVEGPSDRGLFAEVLQLTMLETYPELRELGRLSLRERAEALAASYLAMPSSRWVGLVDEQPAGGIWLSRAVHPVLETSEALIVAVAVFPDFRGRGLGRALVNHGIAWARQEGLSSIRLFVNPDNAHASALYKELGFRTLTEERRLPL